eukprot:m.107746 g.107746  ORF g.107746 m.107746 type:complete len:225 (+) comp15318_c0_seq5:664-1338(+)
MLCFWYVPCFRMDSIVCSVFQSSMGFYRKSVAQVPSETHVLPVINCSHSVNLGCQLLDGSKILGQNNISHPGKTVIKEGQQPALAAPIQRIFYINDWQQEIVQRVDDEVVTDLLASKSGLGRAIAQHPGRKILLLNGCLDRETAGMTASQHVVAVARLCQQDCQQTTTTSDFVTDVIYPETTTIPLDWEELAGVHVHPVTSGDNGHYDLTALTQQIINLHSDSS